MFGNYVNPFVGYGASSNSYAQNNPNYYNPNAMQNNNQLQPNVANPVPAIKFVTEDEAKAYIIPPNSQILLMDKNDSIFYIKSSDNLGRSTLESYKFEKYDANKQNNPENNNVSLENFVQKQDLEQFIDKDTFKEKLDSIENKLGSKIEELKRSINIRKYLEGESKDA